MCVVTTRTPLVSSASRKPLDSKKTLATMVAYKIGSAAPSVRLIFAMSLFNIPYPDTRRDESVVDDYFGTKVADPYRWLENLTSPETKEFVETQRNITRDYLGHLSYREAIRQRVKEVWNFTRRSVPQRVHSRYYQFENSGLQDLSVLYVREGLDEEPRVFFDENKLSKDGTVSLGYHAFSPDGQFFAYSTFEKGSDWKTIKFKSTIEEEDLPDILVNTKSNGFTWSPDSQGIFYTRYAYRQPGNFLQVTMNEKLYYHRVGTTQQEDVLVAEAPGAPEVRISTAISSCKKFLLITGSTAFNTTTVFIARLQDGINDQLRDSIVEVFPSTFGEYYEYVTNEGSTFVFRTSKDAPRYKLVTIDISLDRAREGRDSTRFWSTFLEEHPSRTLVRAQPIGGDQLLIHYINEEVRTTLELRSLKDASLVNEVELTAGSMSEFSCSGNIDRNTLEFFVKIIDYENPGSIYRCLVNKKLNCTVFQQDEVKALDLSKFMTEYVSFPSKDGTPIPMYIVRKKEMQLDSTAPALLFAYGGFNVNTMPRFSVTVQTFLDGFDGVYAQPIIRGGGEFGLEWYDAGVLTRKQNSFDDFQAAAEYLIRNNYTTSEKLAIQGGSNGGLMVAACVNQRPELYGAAIIQNGVLDLLRQQHFTVGRAWCHEYGCSDNKEYFESLLKYSPLHNIRVPEKEDVQYPAVLIMAGDHDDRVVPVHSYKYAAELQHTIGKSSKQTNPLLLRVETDVGHGDGKPISKLVPEVTDVLAFIAESLNLDFRS